MKYLMMLAVTSLLMFSCSKDDEALPGGEVNDGKVIFELSAVNQLNMGGTKAPIYSQAASQHVTRVSVYAFMKQGVDYLWVKTYDIQGWTDGTTSKTYVVAEADKVLTGDYKFLGVGRDASDMFTVTSPTVTTKYEDMLATIANSGDESEIFAGTGIASVVPLGVRVTIPMTRQVAGVLGYFKNVPQTINGTTVRYLRLTATNASKGVSLSAGTGANATGASYRIIDMDLSGQPVSGGVYTGNNVAGVTKLPNSQLNGSYYMPVSAISLTLGLYDTNGVALREWAVKDVLGTLTTYDILANHFYSLGQKYNPTTTTGDDPLLPTDDDNAIDLFTDQNILITITPAWGIFHYLTIQ